MADASKFFGKASDFVRRLKMAMGVMMQKKINPIIRGLVILCRSFPRKYHPTLRGRNTFGKKQLLKKKQTRGPKNAPKKMIMQECIPRKDEKEDPCKKKSKRAIVGKVGRDFHFVLTLMYRL